MSGSSLLAQEGLTIRCGPACRAHSLTRWRALTCPHIAAAPRAEAAQRSATAQHVLQAWKGAEDADIAVFRFTLGIPGFDDALLPRVVGFLGAALLIANHLFDQTAATAAQARTEALGAALSALCIATPSIGARLRSAQPGRGRTAGAADQSSGQVFQIAADVPDDVKTELAWASYSLLRNTNSSGLLVASSHGKVQVVRGAVRQAAGPSKGQAVLSDVQKDLQGAAARPTSPLAEVMSSSSAPVYLPDASALARADLRGALLPDSACSALVQPLRPLSESRYTANASQEPTSVISASSTNSDSNGSAKVRNKDRTGGPPAGILVLWSDRPRALSQRERIWAAAVAAKLFATLSW